MDTLANIAPFLLSQMKGYCNIEDIEQFIHSISSHPHFSDHYCYIALPSPLLRELSSRSFPPGIVLGAKSMDSLQENSFTEEIAIPLLQRAKAQFVLVGSVESRQIHKESTSSINQKIRKLLETGIQPILCIHETSEENDSSQIVNSLTEQIKEGLRDLKAEEQTRVIIFYEIPSMLSGPKKYTLADCQTAYNLCREAIRSALPEEVHHHMTIVYTFPDELEDYVGLIEQSPSAGFYTRATEHFLSLLDALETGQRSATPLFVSTHEKLDSSIGPSNDLQVEQSKMPIVSAKQAEPSSLYQEMEKTEIVEGKKLTDISEQAPATAYNHPLSDPGLEEPTEDISEILSDKPEIVEEIAAETLPAEETPLIKAMDEVLEETPIVEEIPPNLKEALGTQSIRSESADAQFEPPESSETSPIPIEDEIDLAQPVENAISDRIAMLNVDGAELTDYYDSMQVKLKRMHELRKEYPPLVEKVTADLNQLDPEVQEQISKGNLLYFKEHPEIFERARPVFENVQKLNGLILEAGAIPREIDRIKIKSKALREKLQANWDYLNAHRLEMKKNHPDLAFPDQPLVLREPPPEIDLSLPALSGPSPLLGKRIGVVKKDNKTESNPL